MEKKRNTGLIVTIIILSLIVVGLGGFVVYDKVLNNDDKVETKIDDNKNENNEEQKDDDTLNKISTDLAKLLYDKVVSLYTFREFYDSYRKEWGKTIEEKFMDNAAYGIIDEYDKIMDKYFTENGKKSFEEYHNNYSKKYNFPQSIIKRDNTTYIVLGDNYYDFMHGFGYVEVLYKYEVLSVTKTNLNLKVTIDVNDREDSNNSYNVNILCKFINENTDNSQWLIDSVEVENSIMN